MLAIIGGTGIYQIDPLEISGTVDFATPFGMPSSPVVRGKMGSHDYPFPCQARGTSSAPDHEVNYRANIFALKSLGATQILGISAVGSLDGAIPGRPGNARAILRLDARPPRPDIFFADGVAVHVRQAGQWRRPVLLLTKTARGFSLLSQAKLSVKVCAILPQRRLRSLPVRRCRAPRQCAI